MRKSGRLAGNLAGSGDPGFIAVGGLGTGCGTTHFAISIGTYLAQVRHLKIAYAELNPSGEIANLIWPFREDEKEVEVFCYSGIWFYPKAKKEILSWLLMEKYDGIVLDFGCITQKEPPQINFCSRRFLLMDSVRWKMYSAPAWGREEEQPFSHYELLSPMAEEKELHLMKVRSGQKVQAIPYQRDPFHLRPPMIQFFNQRF